MENAQELSMRKNQKIFSDLEKMMNGGFFIDTPIGFSPVNLHPETKEFLRDKFMEFIDNFEAAASTLYLHAPKRGSFEERKLLEKMCEYAKSEQDWRDVSRTIFYLQPQIMEISIHQDLYQKALSKLREFEDKWNEERKKNNPPH